MARYTKGALGAFSGKLGNVVGSNWRQIDYLRSLPKPSKRPATQLQLEQRARFALAGSFLSTIKDVLNVGFGDVKRGRSSAYNAAVSLMLDTAILGTYPDFEVDYENLVISKGSLLGLIGLIMVEDVPLTVWFSWQDVTNRRNSFEDDDLVAVLYNKTKKLFMIYEEAQRGDVSLSITFPEVFTGDEIAVWIFMVNRDGDTTSNSQYAGSITLAG